MADVPNHFVQTYTFEKSVIYHIEIIFPPCYHPIIRCAGRKAERRGEEHRFIHLDSAYTLQVPLYSF